MLTFLTLGSAENTGKAPRFQINSRICWGHSYIHCTEKLEKISRATSQLPSDQGQYTAVEDLVCEGQGPGLEYIQEQLDTEAQGKG